jgi:hypothetical protein
MHHRLDIHERLHGIASYPSAGVNHKLKAPQPALITRSASADTVINQFRA